MSYWKKYTGKLFLKQWGVGLMRCDIKDIIRQKKITTPVKWYEVADKTCSYADPFVISQPDGTYRVYAERVTSDALDGTIELLSADHEMNVYGQRTILQKETHLSYPFFFEEDGNVYFFPENAFGGPLSAYLLNRSTGEWKLHSIVLNKRILDATIVKKNDLYWLFCTMPGPGKHSELHLFYSSSLFGPYAPHDINPVKKDASGSRPAGRIVEVDGELYRPTQNCRYYYGQSIMIQRITELDVDNFREEPYMELKPSRGSAFSYGWHTINGHGDCTVIDGQRLHFEPLQQLKRKLFKKH
jgi:hypothetical protein